MLPWRLTSIHSLSLRLEGSISTPLTYHKYTSSWSWMMPTRDLQRYIHLAYGVASAPVIFQRTMDHVHHGLPGVMCYLDDILIIGATDQKQLSNLATVLKHFRAKGFRLKNKSQFMKTTVEYLVHVIYVNRIHTSPKTCQAITEAAVPTNVMELRSFLGLVNYYERLVPSLASGLHLLNRLLRKGATWAWTKKCHKALTESRQCWAHSKCWPTMIHSSLLNASQCISLRGRSS